MLAGVYRVAALRARVRTAARQTWCGLRTGHGWQPAHARPDGGLDWLRTDAPPTRAPFLDRYCWRCGKVSVHARNR